MTVKCDHCGCSCPKEEAEEVVWNDDVVDNLVWYYCGRCRKIFESGGTKMPRDVEWNDEQGNYKDMWNELSRYIKTMEYYWYDKSNHLNCNMERVKTLMDLQEQMNLIEMRHKDA